MRPAKTEGSKSPPSAEPEQTPFERFIDFTRRIIAVPHSEIQAQERAYQHRKRMKMKRRGS